MALLALLSGSLLAGDLTGWLDPVRGVLEAPVLAIQKSLAGTDPGRGLGAFFVSRRVAEERITELEGELDRLAVDQAQLNICEEENREARRLLAAPLPPSWQFLPATVVGWNGPLRLDKGRADGASAGMMVVSANLLVGRIASAEEKSCLVETLADPAVRLPVVVKRPLEGGAEALQAAAGVRAKGLLVFDSEDLVVREILQEEDVAGGDLVLTSGEAGWLADLVIGRVTAVSGREAELYKEATVVPFVKVNDLRKVFIVTEW